MKRGSPSIGAKLPQDFWELRWVTLSLCRPPHKEPSSFTLTHQYNLQTPESTRRKQS